MKNSKQILFETAQKETTNLLVRITEKKTVGRTLALCMSDYALETANRDELVKMLGSIVKKDLSILGAYVAYEPESFDKKDKYFINKPGHDKTGRFIPYYNRLSGTVRLDPLLDYDVPGVGDYYQIPKKTRQECIIDPYDYEGVVMVSFTSPILKSNNFVGIAGVDVSLTDFDNMVSKIKLYENGFAILISENQVIISEKDKRNIGTKNLSKLAEKYHFPKFKEILSNKKENDTIETNSYLVAYSSVGDNRMKLFIFVPKNEVMAEASKIKYIIILLSIMAQIVLNIIISIVSDKITNPIINVKNTIQAIALGDADLTKRLPVSTEDEVGQLADWFNKFIDKLTSIIVDINNNNKLLNESALKLANDSEELNMKATANYNESQGLSSGMQEISSTFNSIATSSEQLSNNINGVASGLEEMATSFNEVARSVADTATNIKKTSESSKSATEQVKQLEANIVEINKITVTIHDIAEQTKLLALNATIEAARAGESGKGFAVVASEVKQLSVATNNSLGEIESKIETIVTSIVDVVKEISNISSIMDELSKSANTVSSAVEEQSATAKEISTNIAEASNASNDISKNIGAVADVSKMLSRDMDTMSQNANESSSIAHRAHESCNGLYRIAHELDKIVKQFKI